MPWVPAEQEEFWYFDLTCDVHDIALEYYKLDNTDEYARELISVGNCFKTKEEASIAAKKFKEIFNMSDVVNFLKECKNEDF